CADYTGYFRFGPQPWARMLLAVPVVLAYLAFAALVLRRGERVATLGLGWFLLTLLPVSNLLPIPIPAAERFLSLPLCGIAIASAVAVGRYAERPPTPAARRRAGAAVTAALV